jgi:hypothetical protein
LWIALDTASQREWFSAGAFNINSSGGIVDLSGNPVSFEFTGDTTRLTQAAHSLITIEKSQVFAPGPLRLISGNLGFSGDSIYGVMKMSGGEAFSTLGITILGNDENCPSIPPENCATGSYILQSPTTTNFSCLTGLWFANTSGNSSFTPGLNMPGGFGWVYEAWVVENSSQTYRSLGRFTSFTRADSDTSGPCPGPNPVTPFNNVPGQEFVTGCPFGPNLNNGNYGVFITIEPVNESGTALNTPFPIRLFKRDVIQSSLNCGVPDVFFRAMARDCLLPYARIKITN